MGVVIALFAALSYMFILHYLADFLLQSREMGTKKSTEPKWLFRHIYVIFCVFLIGLFPFFKIPFVLFFSLANAAVHACIDWFIWRGYKCLAKRKITKQVKEDYPGLSEVDTDKLVKTRSSQFKYWEDEYFYATIGLDQLLHILTIVVLFLLFLV